MVVGFAAVLPVIAGIAVMVCIALIGLLGTGLLYCIVTDKYMKIFSKIIIAPILIFLITIIIIFEISLIDIIF